MRTISRARGRAVALVVAVVSAACGDAGGVGGPTLATSGPPTVATAPPPASTIAADPYPPPLFAITGRILFSSEGNGVTEGQGGIAEPITIDATGTHLIGMPPDSTFAHPIWTPDGSIIFDSQRTGPRHLYRMDVTGANVVALTHGSSFQEMASVSADGRTIAYEEYIDLGALSIDLGIHVARADGTGARAVTPRARKASKGGASMAAISPDGRHVAFERSPDLDGTVASLMIVGSDGKGLRRVVPDSYGAASPRWSPDGKRILFTGHLPPPADPAVSDVFVVDASGGVPRPLVSSTAPVRRFEADWSPDGTQVVFKVWAPGWENSELHVVNADGTSERTLWISTNFRQGNEPRWGR